MAQLFTEGTAGGSEHGRFTCPDCSGNRFSTVLHNDEFEYGVGHSAVMLRARVPVHCCDSCDFEFLGDEARLIKHEAVCRHLELLTPTEIRRIRERHGMSRTAFAEITGFGEATLNRWERGAVIQNRANDRYLRLLDLPEILQRLQGPERKRGAQRLSFPADSNAFPGQELQDSLIIRQQQAAFRLRLVA